MTREAAAFKIMNSLLYSKVFSINRIRNELGYVHGASVSDTRNGQKIYFFGQNESAEKLKILEAGWNEVIAMIENHTLSDDSFESAKTGLLRRMTLLPTSVSESLGELSSFNLYGRLDAKQKMIEMMKSLSADEIYAAGKKYLVNQPSLNLYVSRNMKDIPCKDLLSSPAQLKK